MNPDASAYTPSFASRAVRPQTARGPPSATTKHSAWGRTALDDASRPLTAAERLRQLHGKPSEPQAPTTTTAMSSSSHSTHSPAPTATTTHVWHYTKEEMLAIEPHALAAIAEGPIVDEPPFIKIPASFAPLLHLPHAMEYANVDAACALLVHRHYRSPLANPPPTSSSSSPNPNTTTTAAATRTGAAASARIDAATEIPVAALPLSPCLICERGDDHPCTQIAEAVAKLRRDALSSRLGACLMQSREVVEALVQVSLVFASKRGSFRLRSLADQHPHIATRVLEYLCGEGYHIPLPTPTQHEEWARMNAMLRFDALRDNTTRIKTDLSRHWRRRHTQFEHFVCFFSFRDDRPRGDAKNILTRSTKPAMVAILSGDAHALFLLDQLGFFVPPHYYWELFPYMSQALGGEGTPAQRSMQHLAHYLASRRAASGEVLYDPVDYASCRTLMAK